MAQHHPHSRAFVGTLAVGTFVTGILVASLLVGAVTERGWLPWNDESTPQPTAIAASTPPPLPPPVRSSADTVSATDVALADPRVQALLAGREHVATDLGSVNGEPPDIPSAIVEINLNGPTRISGEWASSAWVDCDTAAIPPRVPVPYRATFDNVTGIRVLVNLGTQQVDAIGPLALRGATFIGDQQSIGEHTRIEDCRME